MERVVVDVDAGADDAFAILILLFAEILGLVKIEAITCVTGNTDVDHVVTNVYRILEAAQRTEIPVYRGSNSSFIPPEIQDVGYFGVDGFGDLNWDTEPDTSILQNEIAAIALGRLVIENPGEINVLAIAPVTNIALATKLYPTFASDVKNIYIMGGNHRGVGNLSPAAEFNFYRDPEAVSIIFKEMKSLVHLVTWETSLETSIDYDWRFHVLGSIPNPVMDIINRVDKAVYMENEPYIVSDALLVACFLFPDNMILKQQMYSADIELHGSQTRGQVVLDHLASTTPNIVIMEQLNKEYFMNLLLNVANMTKIQ